MEWRDSAGSIKSVLQGNNDTHHRIAGLNYPGDVPTLNGNLVEGETYTVRVVAVPTASDATEVPSAWSAPVKTFHVPLKLWFTAGTPRFNDNVARVFVTVDSTAGNTSATCTVGGGNINCPPNTLVSVDVFRGVSSPYQLGGCP